MNPSQTFVVSDLMQKANAEEGEIRDILETFEIIGLLHNSGSDQFVMPPEFAILLLVYI